jgi:alpha-1,3-mannosyl-glycoprotein beta-1,2-N-acetylglucosaminyltransferase
MKIMRSRQTFIIIAVICFWSVITYVLLTKQGSISDTHISKYSEKLSYLEYNINKEAEIKNQLEQKIIEILRQRNEDPPTANNEVVAQIHVPNVLDFTKIYMNNDRSQPIVPVIVFACNRITINKCLNNLIAYRPNKEQFPIIVSQDCDDEPTRNVILSYKDEVYLIQQPDQSDIPVPPKEKKFKGYYKIARHYGWALNTTFKYGFEYVIIVEDDLNVAPDFFEYFLGTIPLLKKDPSLWCVSAWNDNGKGGLIDESHPELLYRSDFFPGLGWMMSKDLWSELSVKWPKS